MKSINIRRWNFSDFDQRKYFAPGPAAVGRRVPLEWAIMQLRQRCSSHARTVFLPALSCLPACLATPNLFSGMSIRVKTKPSLLWLICGAFNAFRSCSTSKFQILETKAEVRVEFDWNKEVFEGERGGRSVGGLVVTPAPVVRQAGKEKSQSW